MVWRRLNEMAGIRHRSDKVLKEQDDLFGGGDDEGGDEGGDDGGDDMFGDPDADEEGGDEEGGDEEEEEEEEEEEVKLSNEEVAELGPGEIDQELDRIMTQIFDDSSKAAQAKQTASAGYAGTKAEDLEESLSSRSLKFLLEQEEAEEAAAAEHREFDMGLFCQEISRYIHHYDTLIDMEGMIFNKAKQFLLNNFNEATGKDFEDVMALEHGIDFTEQYVEDEPIAIAVGAGGEGGGGGGV